VPGRQGVKRLAEDNLAAAAKPRLVSPVPASRRSVRPLAEESHAATALPIPHSSKQAASSSAPRPKVCPTPPPPARQPLPPPPPPPAVVPPPPPLPDVRDFDPWSIAEVERASAELAMKMQADQAANNAATVADLRRDAAAAGIPLPTDIDWNSPEAIRIEQTISFTYGRKFKDRGPPPPTEGGPQLWRNQAWRESSGRWGNRGGKNKEAFAAKYGGKARSSGSSSGKGSKGEDGEQLQGSKGEHGRGGKDNTGG